MLNLSNFKSLWLGCSTVVVSSIRLHCFVDIFVGGVVGWLPRIVTGSISCQERELSVLCARSVKNCPCQIGVQV